MSKLLVLPLLTKSGDLSLGLMVLRLLVVSEGLLMMRHEVMVGLRALVLERYLNQSWMMRLLSMAIFQNRCLLLGRIIFVKIHEVGKNWINLRRNLDLS